MGIVTTIPAPPRTLAAALTTIALAVPVAAQTFPALSGRLVDAAQVLGPGVRDDSRRQAPRARDRRRRISS